MKPTPTWILLAAVLIAGRTKSDDGCQALQRGFESVLTVPQVVVDDLRLGGSE